MKIEPPACELGYPGDQLERILGDRLPAFGLWMSGQTGVICDGQRYSYERGESEPTGCGPHGPVVYATDLTRFLAGRPIID